MNKGKSILIIDDDSRNIFALSAVLKAKGLQVKSAPNMQDAFSILKSDSSIGVILMDMMMPDMDGYEATATLKKDAMLHHIPVIAVTAQAMTGDREKCLAAGAEGYISKPVDVDMLLQLLEEHLK
jgi:two-component system, cell cycle response regulator DivK